YDCVIQADNRQRQEETAGGGETPMLPLMAAWHCDVSASPTAGTGRGLIVEFVFSKTEIPEAFHLMTNDQGIQTARLRGSTRSGLAARECTDHVGNRRVR